MIQGGKRRFVCHGLNNCGADGLHERRASAARPTNEEFGAGPRRLLAIATVLEEATREEGAKIGGMDHLMLRDWVIQFNERLPNGLINITSLGVTPKLNGEHNAFAFLRPNRGEGPRGPRRWCAGGHAI